MFFDDDEWIDFDKVAHLNNIKTFILFEDYTKNTLILICGTPEGYYILNYLFTIFNKKKKNINEYALVGAGNMSNSVITGFKSVYFNINTSVHFKVKILELFDYPEVDKKSKSRLL